MTVSFAAATLHEAAGQRGALPSAIKPISPRMRLEGPAFTVRMPPGNNLWLHRAIATAAPGDVLVAIAPDHHEAGYWGEIMTVAALARGIAGLVIDGSVRDGEAIERRSFPVFARGLSIRGTRKDPEPGGLQERIAIGDVTIDPGDLVVGDADGVVVVPAARVPEVMEKARERERNEAEVMERLKKGETTLDIYGWK